MTEMFLIKNIDYRQNSFVARDATHALSLAIETIPVWRLQDLTATPVSFPKEILDICERDQLYGVLTSLRRTDIYVGGKLVPKK